MYNIIIQEGKLVFLWWAMEVEELTTSRAAAAGSQAAPVKGTRFCKMPFAQSKLL